MVLYEKQTILNSIVCIVCHVAPLIRFSL